MGDYVVSPTARVAAVLPLLLVLGGAAAQRHRQRPAVWTPCVVNSTFFGPMSCPSGTTCTPRPDPNRFRCTESPTSCTVCAECCHALNTSMCDSCVKAECNPASFADDDCCKEGSRGGSGCCARGVPKPPSTTLKNCLLIGDSVTNGLSSVASARLASVCQTQLWVNLNAQAESACFNVSGAATALGLPIKWDVIHFNEGLHSLWPRVNTSIELEQWASQLGEFTDLLKTTGATLIYATMTPFMPEKYLNPPGAPRSDVETKNAVAVKTVKAHGVARINDLYLAVTSRCGDVYRDCTICDDESKYHPQGDCGYHYNAAGWDMLGTAVADAIQAAL